MRWLKNTPIAHVAQFLLAYARKASVRMPAVHGLYSIDKWEHEFYTNVLTLSAEPSDSLPMPLGEAVCVCKYLHLYIRIYKYVYVYVYVYICICICICICNI